MENGKHIKQTEVPKRSGFRLLSPIMMVLIMLLSGMTMKAQTGGNITVSGIVTDGSGETLIGASVVQKGTTNASMTGLDGDYKLTVPSNATLVVTYVGFNPKEVQVNGKTKLDIVVSEDTKLLDEVVVTALGIKRDKKSLGYALQEIKGDQLMETRDPNVANALAGKVAGLQIKQNGSGPAGSSRIVLRGNNSIGGNNQPLIVVDGVPIDNFSGGTDDLFNGGIDKGSGLSDIAPDDIESMSVLKGPAAAALYGSRAGNGVIMITTKKSSGKKGLGISYNTNFVIENPMQLPKYQNTYGQGLNGKYDVTASSSWGEKMTGQTVKDVIGRDAVYASYGNDLEDIMQTGTTWTNSIDISNSTDKGTFRVGVMNLSNKGVVPNSSFGRTSATIRGTAKLSDKFSVDAKLTYINQQADNRIKIGGDPDNIFYNYLLTPRSVHLTDYKDQSLYPNYGFAPNTIATDGSGINLSGLPASWVSNHGAMIRNPYWSMYKNTNSDKRNRLIGFGSLKYDFNDWLNIQGRYGMDYYASQYKNRQATNTPFWEKSGDYRITNESFYEINSDFLITATRDLSDKIGLVATGGGNIMYRRLNTERTIANGLVIPDFFRMDNAKRATTEDRITRSQVNSLYATASFSYDNTLYLDLTARNDWSSTLNPNNRSFFYPSVGASWLITESLDKWDVNHSAINFAKLRVSWAQVGNSADAYQLLNERNISVTNITNTLTNQSESYFFSRFDETKRLYDLKNELVESYEIGLELKAFNNRLGLDFAFYNKDAKDQILKMNIPASSGFTYKYINAGNVRNRGIELVLSGTPVQTKDFQWSMDVNYSRNKNTIVKLYPGVEQQILNHVSTRSLVEIVAKEGGSYGDIYGIPYLRNDNGDILIDDSGLPIFDTNKKKLGNSSPLWMGGIVNYLTYKNFDVMFQIDMRYGGDVYMGSIARGMGAGTLEGTLAGRESMTVEGIRKSDNAANTTQTTAQEYWGRLGSGSEPWIYDATNIRFREFSVGYTIPRKALSKTPFQAIKLSLVGRNLFMIYSKTKGFDPEAGFTSSNAQGIEFGSMPTLRSYGFNLNVSF